MEIWWAYKSVYRLVFSLTNRRVSDESDTIFPKETSKPVTLLNPSRISPPHTKEKWMRWEKLHKEITCHENISFYSTLNPFIPSNNIFACRHPQDYLIKTL